MATVTDEQLLAVALATIDHDDKAHLAVLADAIEENGLWSRRRESWWYPEGAYGGMPFLPGRPLYPEHVVAVLLFGDWPTSWPLAERCRRRDGRRVAFTLHLRNQPALAVAQFPRDAVGDD